MSNPQKKNPDPANPREAVDDENALTESDPPAEIDSSAKTLADRAAKTLESVSPADESGNRERPNDPNQQDRLPDQANTVEDSVDPLTELPTLLTDEPISDGPPAAQKKQLESSRESRGYPERIARYETISVLGEGAYGIVLKCSDPQLDRLVAVKIAKSHSMSSELAVQRFLAEARAAAQLRHPNIVPVFEYGKYESNHFIAYQYVEGKTLKELHQKGLTPRQAIELMIPVCRGLDYAHSHGIIHRDIKPANILIDGQGVPHIADFGCAREVESDETLTIDGSLLGTPAYMSPEAAAGKANLADARSDIWGVGIVIYELLTQRRPFRGGIGKILADIQTVKPASIRSHDRNLPIDLATIVGKCLDQDPDHRFPTAGVLADELQRWYDGRPIVSRRINPLQRIWMWSRRNPRWAAMWGALAATLLIGLAITLFLLSQVQQKQNRLVQSHLDSLLTANPASVPVIIDDLKALDANVENRLDDLLERSNLTRTQSIRLQLAKHLLGDGDDDFQSGGRTMLQLSPSELDMVTSVIREFPPGSLKRQLWPIALSSNANRSDSLRAACCLAQLDADSENWNQISLALVGELLDENPTDLAVWLKMLLPVATHLKDDLQTIFSDAVEPETRRRATQIMAVLFSQDIEFLLQMAEQAEPDQLRELVEPLNVQPRQVMKWVENSIENHQPDADRRSNVDAYRRVANSLILAACLGETDELRTVLQQRQDPTLRSALIHWAPQAGLPVRWVRENLSESNWKEPFVVIGCLQMLAEYGEQAIYLTERNELKNRIVELYEKHPDAGVHSSAQWLLMEWDFEEDLAAARTRQQTKQPKTGFQWHEDPCGICFAIFGPVDSFEMGQPGDRSVDQTHALFHTRKIPRRFGISTTEITREQYLKTEGRFRELLVDQRDQADETQEKELWTKRLQYFDRMVSNRGYDQPNQTPATNVSWIEAAIFCAWLGRQQEFESTDMPYQVIFPENKNSFFARYEKNELLLPGYRLPTDGEFEFSARAAAKTKFHFGQSFSMISEYAWTSGNASGKAHRVGRLKPNHFGLFDVHGNASEWCHNPLNRYPEGTTEWVDGEVAKNDDTFSEVREIRDHYFDAEPSTTAVYRRDFRSEQSGLPRIGFRVARTYSAIDPENSQADQSR